MVDNIYAKKIKAILKNTEPRSQKEISERLGEIDRAILTGYLRCMVDLQIIECKNMGRTKIYFLKRKGIR